MHLSETDANRQRGVRWTHGFFFNACVIAWMKADYLQFRREELRRQRPTEIARDD